MPSLNMQTNSHAMLNALKLSELLAKNVDPQLYPRML